MMSKLFRSIVYRDRSITNKQLSRGKTDVSDILEDFESLSTDKYVTVADEDGTMVPPLSCEFCKVSCQSHILCVVDEKGDAVLYNTNQTAQRAFIKVWQAHSNAVFDVEWMESSKILTASGDQTVALWDIEKGERIDTFRGHTSSVRSVNLQRDSNAVFATGSRDGHIMIWDARCSRKDGCIQPVNTLRNVHTLPQQPGGKAKRKYKLPPARDSQMSVIDVKFQTDKDLWSAGAVDGCVKLWDVRKNYSMSKGECVPKHTFTYCGVNKREHGYSSLVFDSSCSQLFASCTDDIIYQFDAVGLNPKPVQTYRGHQNSTFYIKASVSPDDSFIVTGSTDEVAYIYQIGNSKRSPVVLKGHTQEVSAVRWSPIEMTKLVTLSDDCMMRIWRLHRRCSRATPDEVSGIAERTHREIGITAEEKQSTDVENVNPNIVSAMSHDHIIPSTRKLAPSDDTLKHLMNGKSPHSTSPSIKAWLTRSAQKGNKHCLNNSEVSPKTEKEKAKSIFGNQKLPCKRKLVEEDDSENDEKPAKKKLMQMSPVKAFSPSPKKLQSPRKLEIKCSPRKLCLSPEFRNSVLRDIGPSLASKSNSPKKFLPKTPSRIDLSCKFDHDAKTVRSPTVNLPNLVLDGSVNKVNIYHRKEDKENNQLVHKVDWLTRMRIKKYGTDQEDNSGVLLKQNTSDKTSPVRFKVSSQESTESSQESLQEKIPISKTPSKGMKSLLHYFKAR